MKNSTTTLLAAATLFTLTLASQSAMAMNEDSGSYDFLNGKSQSVSALSMPNVSYRSTVNPLAIGASEGGYDSAYVGSSEAAQAVMINNTGDYVSMQQSLRGSLSHTRR